MTLRKIILFVIGCCTSASLLAQQVKDAGLWANAQLNFDLGKNLIGYVAPEVRLDENLTRVYGAFSDFGVSKKWNDWMSMKLEYRAAARYNDFFYEYRQRLSYGLALKYDIGEFSFSSTTRAQFTPRQFGGESDVDIRSVVREKVGVKYSGLKKVDLSSSFEMFTDNRELILTDWRWQGNIEYKIKKDTYFSIGYLIQKDLTSQDMDFVFQLGYECEIKAFKKWRKSRKEPEQAAPAVQ